MSQVAIVVPTIRPQHALEFLEAWRFDEPVYLVEDNPQRTFEVVGSQYGKVRHLCWQDIDDDLGDNSWIISRRNSGIRCYGFLRAVRDGADVVITLDDDCLPNNHKPGYTFHLVSEHLHMLEVTFPRWVSTIESNYPARGMPYRNRGETKVVLNMGGWTGVSDVDAMTELVSGGSVRDVPMRRLLPVPQGTFFPMCWMNLSFKRELLPLMYAPLMAEGKRDGPEDYVIWPFNRFDDIWCGIFVKKICDMFNLAVTAGWPIVKHGKASNVWANLRKEIEGVIVNEYLWQLVDAFTPLSMDTISSAYCGLAEQVEHSFSAVAKNECHKHYWKRLGQAMQIWVKEVVHG